MERLTWEQITERYPDRWVFIAEPEADTAPYLKSSIVLAAHADKKELYKIINGYPPDPSRFYG